MKTVMESTLRSEINKFKGFIRKRIKKRLEIILYHFVSDREDDFTLSGHTVQTGEFKHQLHYISQNYRIVPLREICSLSSGQLAEEGPFASICFDDGYLNILTEAYPVLEKFQIPATVFVNPSVLNNRGLLWRDKIRYLIKNNMAKEFITYLKQGKNKGHYNFDLLKQQSLLYSWSKNIKAITDMSIQTDLDLFFKTQGIDSSQIAFKHNLFMSDNDIKKYLYLDFGNHTWSHPIMTLLNYEQQKEEIVRCHNYLRDKGVEPIGFSLPFSPYDNNTFTICEEVGYNFILTVYNRSNLIAKKQRDELQIFHRRMAPRNLQALKQIM